MSNFYILSACNCKTFLDLLLAVGDGEGGGVGGLYIIYSYLLGVVSLSGLNDSLNTEVNLVSGVGC